MQTIAGYRDGTIAARGIDFHYLESRVHLRAPPLDDAAPARRSLS